MPRYLYGIKLIIFLYLFDFLFTNYQFTKWLNLIKLYSMPHYLYGKIYNIFIYFQLHVWSVWALYVIDLDSDLYQCIE